MPAPPSDARIDLLLAKLRAAGLRIGVTEQARVHFLLASHADLGNDLPAALLAILTKSESERARFREVCERWAIEAAPQTAAAPSGQTPVRIGLGDARVPLPRSPQRPRPPRWLRWAALGLVLCACLGAGGYVFWRRGSRPPVVQVPPAPPPNRSDAVKGPTQYIRLQPVFDVLPPPYPWAGWLWLALAPVSLASALALYLRQRKQLALPTLDAPPQRKGPARVYPTRPDSSGPSALLLDRREEEAAIWGIGRFVSEQPTRRLDIAATVRATVAAAGLPQLVFHAARHTREVWFWLDDALPLDSPLRRLTDELAQALRRGGLVVEVALFYGLPDQLQQQPDRPGLGESVTFCPAEVEDRRDSALVCVLTDGRLLSHRLQQADTHLAVAATLRGLSNWPRLCVVDGGPESAQDSRLRALLSPWDLDVITPAALPAFLAGQQSAPPQAVAVQTTASGLLTPGGDLNAWAAACALAPFPLDDELAQDVRVRLRLRESPWQLANLRQLAQRQGSRFYFSAATRAALLRWLVESDGWGPTSVLARALHLWRDVLEKTAAQRQQGDPSQPWQGTPAEQRLRLDQALLDLWDAPEKAAVDLHRISGTGLGPELTRLLGEYGPRGAAPPQIALPWRWLGLSPQACLLLYRLGLGGLDEKPRGLRPPSRYVLALAALLCAPLGAALHALRPAKDPGPPTVAQPTPPPGAQVHVEPSGQGYRVIAQLGDSKAQKDVPPRARVTVRWIEQKQAARTDRADWCPYQQETHQGVVFVRVCAGEFTMGSEESDADAASDEKPAHRVKLDEFQIGKFEISNAQYRLHDRAYEGLWTGGDRPAVAVSWNQAKQFCEAQGWRLPTEAEWEYAARGRDGRKYPWPEDAGPTRQRAVYRNPDAPDNPDGPEAVTSHPEGQGPFGTLHQAGNVWEWVADCYAPYATSAAVLLNPVVEKQDCGVRVLRGGSFGNGPRFLRSAYRFRAEPEFRSTVFGFRCVRSVSRQP